MPRVVPLNDMEAATVAGGYFGRALVVDLADASAERLPLPDGVLRAYIGGAGLGAWLMHRLAPPGVDPLGPEAPLATGDTVSFLAADAGG